MANNCGDCEDEKYTPESVCCPDTADSGVSVDVRDRNCKVKRVRGSKGLFGAIKGKVIQFLDGSSSQPIELSLESVISSNGYVVIQTNDGRILALGAAESTVPLQLVYDSGTLKFVPFAATKNYIDADLVSSDAMVLAGFSCLADGNVQLGKFIPGCTGDRALVISEDGKVRCDAVEVGMCRDTPAVNEFDTIWGCKDGVFSPLAPVEGKVLIGTGASPDTKWALGDGIQGFTMISPRATVKSVSYLEQSGVFNDTIDWTIQSGYNAAYRYALIRVWIQMQSRGIDFNAELDLDGRYIIQSQVREHGPLSVDTNTNSDQQWVIIPGSKNSALTYTVDVLSGTQYGGGLNSHAYKIDLEGWHT
jgi:hypothetical protein